MPSKKAASFRRPARAAAAIAAVLAWAAPAQARVTRIIIDKTQPLAGQTTGEVPYETLIGRAFGELNPNSSHNTLITDIGLASRNGNGKVEYVASFFIVKPVLLSNASGLLWHDVPNRGGRITISADLRMQGDIGLSSGWQGDNAGPAPGQATTVPDYASTLAPVATRHPIRARIAYHDACHLAHAQRIRSEPRRLLSGIPGVELVEIPDGEQCCGSAGIYNLVEPESADEIGRRKADNVLSVRADLLASANPGCTLQIQKILRERGEKLPAAHPIEILAASIAGRRYSEEAGD